MNIYNKKKLYKNIFKQYTSEEIQSFSIHHNLNINQLIKVLTLLTINKTTSIHHILGSTIKQHEPEEIINLLNILTEQNIIIKNNLYYSFNLEIPSNIQDMIDNSIYPIPLTYKPKHTNHVGIKPILNSNNLNKDYCEDLLKRINKIPLNLNNKIINNNQYTVKEKELDYRSHKIKQQCLSDYRNKLKDIYTALNMHDQFYITNSYDKRGRIYSNGYHINPQGNDYNKSVIEFYHKEKIE